VKLAVGADHAGYKLKWQLVNWLRTPAGGGHQILDVGTVSEDSVDYPDFAREVAQAVAHKRVAKGILLCGTGIGMAIAANKVRGIRAGVAWNPKVAALAAEHNEANVLCVPGRFTSLPTAKQIVKTFLRTPFGGGRHLRRVKKITALDKCA
jgi:ribose 5-phosphate isomerase B